jgi:hypothetical protein
MCEVAHGCCIGYRHGTGFILNSVQKQEKSNVVRIRKVENKADMDRYTSEKALCDEDSLKE